jgi:hypothetical protein
MKRFVYLLMVIALLLGCSGRREQMSALLDRADSLNRAYVPMTGGLDSLLLEAADYRRLLAVYGQMASLHQQPLQSIPC